MVGGFIVAPVRPRTDGSKTICPECGGEDVIHVSAHGTQDRPQWRACRRCLHTTTVFDRRLHRPNDLARRVHRALLDGYEVWSSDSHTFVLEEDDASHLRRHVMPGKGSIGFRSARGLNQVDSLVVP